MTDEQLAQFLGIHDDPRWPTVIVNLPDLRRKTYERMATLEIDLNLWHKGLGPKPRGVLIDMARIPRKSKKPTTKLRRPGEGLVGRGGAAQS